MRLWAFVTCVTLGWACNEPASGGGSTTDSGIRAADVGYDVADMMRDADAEDVGPCTPGPAFAPDDDALELRTIGPRTGYASPRLVSGRDGVWVAWTPSSAASGIEMARLGPDGLEEMTRAPGVPGWATLVETDGGWIAISVPDDDSPGLDVRRFGPDGISPPYRVLEDTRVAIFRAVAGRRGARVLALVDEVGFPLSTVWAWIDVDGSEVVFDDRLGPMADAAIAAADGAWGVGYLDVDVSRRAMFVVVDANGRPLADPLVLVDDVVGTPYVAAAPDGWWVMVGCDADYDLRVDAFLLSHDGAEILWSGRVSPADQQAAYGAVVSHGSSATFVWQSNDEAVGIGTRTIRADGTMTPPGSVSSNARSGALLPSIATDGTRLVAAWSTWDDEYRAWVQTSPPICR